MKEIPSEKFLLTQRLFTFLDEWLFYALLGYLIFSNASFVLVALTAIIGTAATLTSYARLWRYEQNRFG